MQVSAGEVRAVFLVGFMGSGKNTVGRELAHRLGWDFIDLDSLIESHEHQTIPDIFRLRGEHVFRQAETSTLRNLLVNLPRPSVVALGGGAFAQEINRELLRPWPSVFLNAPTAEHWQRCLQHESKSGAERPLRKDPDQFAKLHAERLPSYRQASFTVETSGKDVTTICLEIEHAFQLRGVLDGTPP
jgi:shikimate kinase